MNLPMFNVKTITRTNVFLLQRYLYYTKCFAFGTTAITRVCKTNECTTLHQVDLPLHLKRKSYKSVEGKLVGAVYLTFTSLTQFSTSSILQIRHELFPLFLHPRRSVVKELPEREIIYKSVHIMGECTWMNLPGVNMTILIDETKIPLLNGYLKTFEIDYKISVKGYE